MFDIIITAVFGVMLLVLLILIIFETARKRGIKSGGNVIECSYMSLWYCGLIWVLSIFPFIVFIVRTFASKTAWVFWDWLYYVESMILPPMCAFVILLILYSKTIIDKNTGTVKIRVGFRVKRFNIRDITLLKHVWWGFAAYDVHGKTLGFAYTGSKSGMPLHQFMLKLTECEVRDYKGRAERWAALSGQGQEKKQD